MNLITLTGLTVNDPIKAIVAVQNSDGWSADSATNSNGPWIQSTPGQMSGPTMSMTVDGIKAQYTLMIDNDWGGNGLTSKKVIVSVKQAGQIYAENEVSLS